MFRTLFAGIFGAFAAAGVVGVVAFYALVLALIPGWFMNIYQLVMYAVNGTNVLADGVLVMFILKIVGVFFGPLGGILGWVTFFS